MGNADTFPQTRDDERVQTLIDHLGDIPEFAGGPKLPRLDPASDDNDGHRFDIETVRGTAFDEHVRDIIDWLETFTGKVNSQNELAIDAPHDRRFVKVIGLAYQTPHFSPYSLHFICFASGRVKVDLSVQPYGKDHARDNRDDLELYAGDAADFDAETVRDQLVGHQPYVTSRVEELTRWHDVNPSEARVTALRELGVSFSDIADIIGNVSGGTMRSYGSRFTDAYEDAEGLFVAQAGVPKRVLSRAEFEPEALAHDTTRYICQSVSSVRSADSCDDRPIWLVSIEEADARAADGAGFSVSSERFESLAALVDETFDGREFDGRGELQAWRKLFRNIDTAMVDEDVPELVDNATVQVA